MIRYCARPPFALERLEWREGEDDPSGEGGVLYHLARSAHGGRTVVRLTPLELLDRLATRPAFGGCPTDPFSIREVLDHLEVLTRPPGVRAPRGPPEATPELALEPVVPV